MLKFSSDYHFGHENIMKFCPNSRPFSGIEEMDTRVIEIHNENVKSNDDFYFLGDFAFHYDKEKMLSIFNQLNGRKHLIIGNHDKNDTIHLPWESVNHYLEIKYNKRTVVMCHYPIEEWNKMRHEGIHVHGHIHSNPNDKKIKEIVNRTDVGFDYWRRPVSFEELTA